MTAAHHYRHVLLENLEERAIAHGRTAERVAARDERAVRAAAETFRTNPDLDVAEVITELKVGEALVSVLDEDGAPHVVARVLVKPPRSRAGVLTDAERAAVIASDPVGSRYDQLVDRESAEELLGARAEQAAKRAAREAEEEEAEKRRQKEEKERNRKSRSSGRRRSTRMTPTERVVNSATRTITGKIGREIGNMIMRGILGGMSGRR